MSKNVATIRTMTQTMAITGLAVLLSLTGCAHKRTVKTPIDAAGVTVPSGGQNGASTNGDAAGANSNAVNGATVGGGSEGVSAPAGVARLVYFDFDSSEIRPEFVSVIAAHARALSANASVRVRLEGHSDERGSPEYNIGLGERRDQAVRRALLLQGVAESQLSTVSYGEERPAVAGATEDAWAKNRRVEIVYLN